MPLPRVWLTGTSDDFDVDQIVAALGLAHGEADFDTALGGQVDAGFLSGGVAVHPGTADLGEHDAGVVVVVGQFLEHKDCVGVGLSGRFVDDGPAVLIELGGEIKGHDGQGLTHHILGFQLGAAGLELAEYGCVLSDFLELRHCFFLLKFVFYFCQPKLIQTDLD